MQVGIGQSRCFTVLSGSCFKMSELKDTVKLVLVWEDTRYISRPSYPLGPVFPGTDAEIGSLPFPVT